MASVLDGSEPVVVVGLGFGDEGKGTTVDALARRLRADTVVRFNGGPQAAHHVVTPHATHCFAQLGAATLAGPAVATVASPRMLIEPRALLREVDTLRALGVDDPLARLSLDPRSVVVTPLHRLMNRAHEIARGQARHGSCGLGVGQAYQDALNPHVPTARLGELLSPELLRRKLSLMRGMKIDQLDQLADQHPALAPLLAELRRPDLIDATLDAFAPLAASGAIGRPPPDPHGPLLLEGAQGVLLDEHHGFWPHVTPSTTTFAWADEWLAGRRAFHLGVLRIFHTRHGAGPLVDQRDEPALLRGEHNTLGDWQGAFRAGWLDLVLARYAVEVAGRLDGLALTCLDRLDSLPAVGVVTAWRYQGDDDVRDLFDGERDGDTLVVTRIRAQTQPSRERQARLCQALGRCVPIVTSHQGWRDERDPAHDRFVRHVQDALGVPVVLLSRGPCADDKRWV